MKQKYKKKKSQKEINKENIHKGISLLSKHLLFYFYDAPNLILTDEKKLGRKAYANVTAQGEILINTDLYLSPENWAFVIAHNALHLAFGHFDEDKLPAPPARRS